MNIINKNESRIKPYEHKNFYVETQWLGRKPQKLHYLQKFTLPDSTLAGATTPYNLLPDTNRKGLQPLQPYYVGPSTTLPPYNDKIEKKRERLKTDSVQALLTTVNMIVSKWETHFDWQAPQDKWKTKENSNKRTKERRQA